MECPKNTQVGRVWQRFSQIINSSNKDDYDRDVDLNWQTFFDFISHRFLLSFSIDWEDVSSLTPCFTAFSNNSKLIANTPLRVIFSNLFSLFWKCCQTPSFVIYYVITRHNNKSHLQLWFIFQFGLCVVSYQMIACTLYMLIWEI